MGRAAASRASDMKRHENPFLKSGNSPIQNREAFLHLLTSEDLDVLSRELGVPAATLSEWRGHELKRVSEALGGLPVGEQVYDVSLFENRAAS